MNPLPSHPKQPCLPGPELVLLPTEDGTWIWVIANDQPALPPAACGNLQAEAMRYRRRQFDCN